LEISSKKISNLENKENIKMGKEKSMEREKNMEIEKTGIEKNTEKGKIMEMASLKEETNLTTISQERKEGNDLIGLRSITTTTTKALDL
jgi:RecA/RadA recombinase